VQSRVKKLDKIEKVEPPRRRKVADLRLPPAAALGRRRGQARAASTRLRAQGRSTDFDLLIRRRERWCVMGENGAGKSTLLKLVAGRPSPTAGTVTIGRSVKMGYFAQHAMELLEPDETVFES
jgi:ATPase subunit of ABC transporter with duplicated ATPase domains